MTENEDLNSRLYITLRDYLESRIAGLIDTMKATDKSIDRRLEEMNQLRSQINKERGHYVTRNEHKTVHDQIEKDLKDLRTSRDQLAGKASMATVFWAAALALLSVFLSGASLLFAISKGT